MVEGGRARRGDEEARPELQGRRGPATSRARKPREARGRLQRRGVGPENSRRGRQAEDARRGASSESGQTDKR
eukprot:3769126-Pyramimonas_sp.AAC.1